MYGNRTWASGRVRNAARVSVCTFLGADRHGGLGVDQLLQHPLGHRPDQLESVGGPCDSIRRYRSDRDPNASIHGQEAAAHARIAEALGGINVAIQPPAER